MRFAAFRWLALWGGLAFASGYAGANSWSGTWKLDEHLSQPVGPSFIYTQARSGEYTVNTGDHILRFFCDGKEYPTLPQHSLICTQSGSRSMQMIYKANGQIVSHATRTLSPDDKVLTVTSGLGATETKELRRDSYQRTSASTGFVGAWTNKDQASVRPPVLIIAKTGPILSLSFPVNEQHTDVPLNGTDAPIQGIATGVHATLSALPRGNRELLTEQKLDGRIVRDGTLTLTPDGHTLIQETWRPENPSVKERLKRMRRERLGMLTAFYAGVDAVAAGLREKGWEFLDWTTAGPLARRFVTGPSTDKATLAAFAQDLAAL